MAVTANRAPQDWYGPFPNPVVAESLLDRIINTSHQVFTNGPSYRPNKRPKAKTPKPLPTNPDDRKAPVDCGMTALTVPEIQRILITTNAQRAPANQNENLHLAWSDWRRRHQARARWHHHRTRLTLAT